MNKREWSDEELADVCDEAGYVSQTEDTWPLARMVLDARAEVSALKARGEENERLRQAFDEFERGYGRVYNVAIVQNLRDAIKKAP